MNDKRNKKDRRSNSRFSLSMPIQMRLQADGSPLPGACIEIGPNGIRICSKIPLQEAAYVLISFENASNNTHCEGRVVWTQKSEDGTQFESGIDVQRWGGWIPGEEAMTKMPSVTPKKDRRTKS